MHIFTKLDIQWGYNNVQIKEGDEHKAAFKTKYGLWEPMVMFFGLCNSPATFQAMMDWIFRPIKEKWAAKGTKVEKYMDNVAITTCTNEADHIACVTEILELAEWYDLYFKLEKCVFHAPQIDYLGIIIEKGMTHMDPVKVEGIRNWPRPTKVKGCPLFFGLLQFLQTLYQRLCPNCTTTQQVNQERRQMELDIEARRSIYQTQRAHHK